MRWLFELTRLGWSAFALLGLVAGTVVQAQPLPVTDTGALPRHTVENEHVIGLLDQSNFEFVGRSNPDGPYELSARNWTDLYGYEYDGDDPEFVGRSFAYVTTGGFLRRGNFTSVHRGGVAIFDVTDPDDPDYYGTVRPNCATACGQLIRDAEIHDGVGYFSSDRGGDLAGGVFVMDLRADPTNPTFLAHLNDANIGGLNAVHEIGLDAVSDSEAYLYANDSQVNGRVDIYDISNPRSQITKAAQMDDVSTHGVFAQDGVLYVAGDDTVTMFDVADIGNGNFSQIGIFDTPGGFTHSSWPDTYTNDQGEQRNIIYLTHEQSGTDLQVWDVTGILDGSSTEAALIETLANTELASLHGTGDVTNVHNLFLVDDLLFTSWTVGGMVVVDVSDPENLRVIDTFDTTSVETISNFAGAFGVNAAIGLDRVLISDRANGLWVVDVSNVVPEPSTIMLLMGFVVALVFRQAR